MDYMDYWSYGEAERSWLEEPEYNPYEDDGPDADEEYERWRDERLGIGAN